MHKHNKKKRNPQTFNFYLLELFFDFCSISFLLNQLPKLFIVIHVLQDPTFGQLILQPYNLIFKKKYIYIVTFLMTNSKSKND